MSSVSSSVCPEWSKLLIDNDKWNWIDNKYVSVNAMQKPVLPPKTNSLKQYIVSNVYATHNNSKIVKETISSLLSSMKADDWGLNFGAGMTRLHPRLLNLDVIERDNIDIVTDGSVIPFKDGELTVVISQEVIEHIANFQDAINEVHRILKSGGKFYCQAPFVIGYHPGPTDFWRYSKQAWGVIFPEEQWEIERLEVSVGHGTGFYRIAVEFFAVTASCIHRSLYEPVKGIASLLLLPIKLFDYCTPSDSAKHRIPGGYFCVARKK